MNPDNTERQNNQPTLFFPNMNSEARLRELILYVADQCLTDSRFGLTKLNKILYFADFRSYEYYGEPITGVEYMKLQKGPVVKSIWSVLKAMENDGDLLEYKERAMDYDRHRFIALRDANLDLFKPRDIALIDQIIREFWDKTAGEVSDISHGIAWTVANLYESIPYEAALLADIPPTEEEVRKMTDLVHASDRER